MYCPNCGIEIHEEGAFCAKCRKDVAYLTHPEEAEPEEAPAAEASPEEGADAADAKEKTPPETGKFKTPSGRSALFKPLRKGYYCNYCGTFLYPEDNYCYDCGKTTRKKFYPHEEKRAVSLKMLAAAALIVLLGIASAGLYWYIHSD